MAMTSNTAALFGRASKSSENVIVPINDSALSNDTPNAAFFCVHSVSGVAGTDFLDLARHFEPNVRFYGIQAPRSRMRDPLFGGSIESIAEYYADALEKYQPVGPLQVGGYCLGAIIALEMVRILQERGRTTGPLVVIDGAPENTEVLSRWNPQYWIDLASNLPGWMAHADLMRQGSLRSLVRSLSSNLRAVLLGAIGLKRGQKFGGGYSLDGFMDMTVYPPDHKLFIDRLFNALFAYAPTPFSGEVLVYEARTAPLLYSPQIGYRWRAFAPQTQVIRIVGTHIGILREPYVGKLASDICQRSDDFFRRFGLVQDHLMGNHGT